MQPYLESGWTWVWAVLGLVLVISVIWLVANTSRLPRSGDAESALRSLERRYYRGEIDRETYERLRRELRDRSFVDLHQM